MSNFEGGSFELVKTDFCPSCGSVKKVEQKEENKKGSLSFVIFGWIFTAISFLFIPILFGGAALCMGILTYFDRSKTHGAILMFFAAMGLILGSLFSFMVTGTILL